MNNKPRDQSFLAQKPKIGYENSQNRQTENPNAPMLIEEWKNKKQNNNNNNNNKMGLRSIMSHRLCFGALRNICTFYWNNVNFFHPLFFKLFITL